MTAQTGAAVTATDRVRDRSSVKIDVSYLQQLSREEG